VVRADSRLLITSAAYKVPGYHEGREAHPEFDRAYRGHHALLLHWHDAMRGGSVTALPVVTYYLMGANQWCAPREAACRRRD
jgi:hypothetical protein